MKQILLLILVVGILLSSACGASSKKPEDVIPISVSGFIFVEKSEYVKPVFDGEEYSAYSFFEPSISSKFYGKVGELVIDVYKFKEEASARNMFYMLSGVIPGVRTAEEIQIDNFEATLVYREDDGEAYVLWQNGKLVIISEAMGPFDTTTLKTTIPDEQILKDAVIEGAIAVAHKLSS